MKKNIPSEVLAFSEYIRIMGAFQRKKTVSLKKRVLISKKMDKLPKKRVTLTCISANAFYCKYKPEFSGYSPQGLLRVCLGN